MNNCNKQNEKIELIDEKTLIANFPGIVILNLISYIIKLVFSL